MASTATCVRSAVFSAALTGGTRSLLHRLPAVRERLSRKNFRGDDVTLIEGPAIIAGLSGAAMVDPVLALVAVGSGAFGLVDDVAGSADRRGLKGHVAGLLHGEVTTGALKILGIGGTAVLAALLMDRGRLRPIGTPAAAVLIAGSANLMNLFDLRPGRALKVALLADLPLLFIDPELATVPIATGAVVARDDLAGHSMMGDTGSNPLGDVLGAAWARHLGTRGRLVAAAGVVALMLSSEKVSFSRVIDAHPVLHAIDQWGRST